MRGDAVIDRVGLGRGSDPENHDQGHDTQRDIRMVDARADGDQIHCERDPVFSLRCRVFAFEAVGLAEMAADRKPEHEKTEAGEDHRYDIETYGEGVQLFVQHIGGEERDEREPEEEEEVGIKGCVRRPGRCDARGDGG